MKKKVWLNLRKILNISIVLSFLYYIGQVVQTFADYKLHPDLYETYSAPWYTSVIIASVLWGGVILLEVLMLLFVRHKVKDKGEDS